MDNKLEMTFEELKEIVLNQNVIYTSSIMLVELSVAKSKEEILKILLNETV